MQVLRVILAISVLLPLCSGTPANAQSLPAGVLLGTVLTGLTSQLDQVVKDAEAAGDAITVRAGSQAFLVIDQARIAYEHSLNTTCDRLDRSATMHIEEIVSAVQLLEKKTAQDTQAALSIVQQVSISLPLSNRQAQLTTYSPHFAVGGALASTIDLYLNGVFSFAQDQRFEPFLVVGKQTLRPSSNTTQQLLFRITSGLLSDSVSEKLQDTTVIVHIPYEERSGLFGWGRHRRDGVFRVLIGVLPSSPGIITLSHNAQSTVTDTQWVDSQPYSQESSNDDLTQTWTGPTVPDGWRIQSNTVEFKVDWSQGNENDQWSKRPISLDNPAVAYEVHTVHHRFGTSGKVHFHYHYAITKPRTVDNWSDQVVQLKWGDSESFPYGPGSWRIRMGAFDGHNFDTRTTDNQDRFLTIISSGNTLTIAVPAASSLPFYN